MARRPTSKALILGALVATLVATAILSATGGGSSGAPHGVSISEQALSAMRISARFAVLSKAQSNRCDLAAKEMRSMPDDMRLQGGCCFPMDRANYQQQLHQLKAYRRLGVVPTDPYDVSVALAKRLLTLRRIPLSPGQLSTYRRATKLSSLGGPCCCPCWRWQAFKGQARFLIARRAYSAQQLAHLWEREEGCGGPAGA